MRPTALPLAAAFVFLLAACGSDRGAAEAGAAEGFADETAGAETPAAVPGDTDETKPYDGIKPDEVLHFTGTEPFWGGEVSGTALSYSTPEVPDGTAIEVERFAGRGGLSFSGELDEAAFEMTVTPLECSDGMSDRTYPFTVTLKIGEDQRNGCGWTDAQPFEGSANP